MKRWPTKWENIFANEISNIRLVPKYTKNLYNSISRNIILKMVRGHD